VGRRVIERHPGELQGREASCAEERERFQNTNTTTRLLLGIPEKGLTNSAKRPQPAEKKKDEGSCRDGAFSQGAWPQRKRRNLFSAKTAFLGKETTKKRSRNRGVLGESRRKKVLSGGNTRLKSGAGARREQILRENSRYVFTSRGCQGKKRFFLEIFPVRGLG